MGWLVADRPLTHETPADYLTRLYTNETDAARSEVLAASQVGRAVYMAVRHSHRTGEHAGRTYTYAAVILVFNNARDGFGRKSMSECSGPCEVDCPARIFALLSPVAEIPDPGSAADWRERVAAAVARRFRPGQRLHLTEPLGFQKGKVIATEFEVVSTPAGRRGPIFRPVGQSFLCRLPKRLLAVAMAAPSPGLATPSVQLALLP
ncbi:putative cytosolic protein (plasmid) [Roseomonas mucosa]|uniref:DUF6927 domain-containing protein n=1 Tax=Roseomonas mucosa TaxID=207340 RepID=UPI0022001089|nr:hypothetical protein [Roseomonas mucosa]QDJ12053.1 putative cytosolic protein [Roseomonas mucosa]UZO94633.1 putative cytosolic protein [Roseomonas mucosa]